jgi:hypothetical protein
MLQSLNNLRNANTIYASVEILMKILSDQDEFDTNYEDDEDENQFY